MGRRKRYGWMDGWIDGRTDGQMEKLMSRKKHGMVYVCIYKDGWIRISRWINKKEDG